MASRIFTYCSQPDGSEGPLIAIAEDGTVLARWWGRGARDLHRIGSRGEPAVIAAYGAHYAGEFEVVCRPLGDPDLSAVIALARTRPQDRAVCNYRIGDTPENRTALLSSSSPDAVEADDVAVSLIG
jgi:hypothetical protein